MTTIRMNTEAVRDLARQLDLRAMELDHQRAALKSSCARLAWAWQGSNAAHFHHDFNDWLRRFQAQVDQLDQLALRVAREVDEWEQADRGRRFGAEAFNLRGMLAGIGQGASDAFPWVMHGLPAAGMAYYLMKGNIRSGANYPGQVKFYGSKGIKESFLGVSGALTHASVANIPSHLLRENTKWAPKSLSGGVKWVGAGIDFGGKAVQSWDRYDSGSERAGALGYDLAFVAAKTISSPYVQYAVATAAVGALAFVGAPAVVVAGGALVAWWAGGVAWDWAADKFYDFTIEAGVQKAVAGATRSLADAAASVFNASVEGIQSAAGWASARAAEAARAIDGAFSSARSALSGLANSAVSFGF